MSEEEIIFEVEKNDFINGSIGESGNSSEISFSKASQIYDSTILRVSSVLTGLSNQSIYNLTQFLSGWQVAKLAATESDSGVLCLMNIWFDLDGSGSHNELHCGSVWDNIYCWPSTLAGTVTRRSCAEILHEFEPINGQFSGYAIRQCLNNGTWSRTRTNYSACAKALLQPVTIMNEGLSVFVQYMVFVGSIASLLCLIIALTMLYSFRNVWSERIKVHVHLMLSLVLRFVVFLVISEPFVFQRSGSYRDYDILCKAILVVHLYATVTSTSWMFVQGIYLNGKLTTHVFGFGGRRGFLGFYIIGWGFPAILLVIYMITMMANKHSENCWQGYAGMTEIWILIVPMNAEMLLNGLLLLNILRVVVQKRRTTSENSEYTQIKSVAKATLLLFPILGLNNLLFLYNPGGEYETIYVSLNITFGSTQGVLVATVYCFNCTEVHQAIRRSFHRFSSRRVNLNFTSESRSQAIMAVIRIQEVGQQNVNIPVNDDVNMEEFL